MTAPRPSDPAPKPTPGESPWAAAARTLASNPDSPESLRIMSAVNACLAPRTSAIQQLVDALADQLAAGTPDYAGDAAVAAAIAHWEKTCGGPIDPATLELLHSDAASLAQARRNRPPSMSSILSPMPAATDVGYDLGLDLGGVEGTWHRLWAMMSLSAQFGDDPKIGADCQELQQEFERLIGRSLHHNELEALRAHARAHGQARPKIGRD